jgi:hypothetical protein
MVSPSGGFYLLCSTDIVYLHMDLSSQVHRSESYRRHLTPNARFYRYITPAYSFPGTGGTYMPSKGHLGTRVGMVA